MFRGSRVHETLERLYRHLMYEKLNSLDELLEFYNWRWKREWTNDVKMGSEGRESEDFRKEGEEYIRNYYRRYEPFDEGRTIAVEQNVIIDIDEHRLQGKIDRIVVFPDGVYEIHDYKSSEKPNGQIQDTDRQLALYQIGIQQLWGDVREVNLVLHYLASEDEHRSRWTKGQLEDLKRSVHSLIHEIENAREKDEFPATKERCEWCGYQDICPAWGAEIEEVKEERELVDRWFELRDEQKELEEVREKLKSEILSYARREGVNFIRGQHSGVQITQQMNVKLKGGKLGEEGKKLIEKAGKWDEVCVLNTRRLKKLDEKAWGEELLNALEGYAKLEPSIKKKRRT